MEKLKPLSGGPHSNEVYWCRSLLTFGRLCPKKGVWNSPNPINKFQTPFFGQSPFGKGKDQVMAATTKPVKSQANGPVSPAGSENQPVTVPDFLAAKDRGVRLSM